MKYSQAAMVELCMVSDLEMCDIIYDSAKCECVRCRNLLLSSAETVVFDSFINICSETSNTRVYD